MGPIFSGVAPRRWSWSWRSGASQVCGACVERVWSGTEQRRVSKRIEWTTMPAKVWDWVDAVASVAFGAFGSEHGPAQYWDKSVSLWDVAWGRAQRIVGCGKDRERSGSGRGVYAVC